MMSVAGPCRLPACRRLGIAGAQHVSGRTDEPLTAHASRSWDRAGIETALRLHSAFLKGEPGGQRAVFRGGALAGEDFSGSDLRDADFCDCDLVAARFDGADCRGARFQGAVMHGASLGGARLTANAAG